MNRKAYASILAVVLIAISFLMACGNSNRTATTMPADIAAIAGASQSAPADAAFASPLLVTVTTSTGAPVSGLVVTFTAPAAGASGTFAGGLNTATTGATGIATSAVFTANASAGSYTVTASVTGVSGQASFDLTNTLAGTDAIATTSGTPQTAVVSASFAAPLVATVSSGGAPLSGVVVTFAAPSSGASGIFAGGANTATTNASGIATSAAFTANAAAGAYTVTATIAGGATVNFHLTNTAAAPDTVATTSGTPQSAMVSTAFAAPLVATVTADGAPVSGVVVTFITPSSGASGIFAGGLNMATTNSSGVATSAVFTANATAGSYMVTASITGGASASFSLTNASPAAEIIATTSGTPQNATDGTAFAAPLVATVTQAGAPVGGVVVTFAAPGSGASGIFAGGLNTATTNSSGVATSAVFTANALTGSYTVTATIAGGAATGFSLTNTAAAAQSIATTSGTPQNATDGTAFAAPLVATVTQAGVPVNGVVVTFAAPGSGASGTFAGGLNTATTNASGVATSAVFTANATAGSYMVTATIAGGAATGFSLTNTAAAAQSIATTSGTPQNATDGTAFAAPLVATVTQAGVPVGGVVVTFAAPGSGASGIFAGGLNTATTNSSGVATSAVFTANALTGSYTVTATIAGGAATGFSLTNTAAAADAIATTSGTPQSAEILNTFAAPLAATVTAGGMPAPGVVVTFTAPVSLGRNPTGTFAGGLNTATATTDNNGLATSAAFTANGSTGSYTVTASIPGGATATFNLTNTAPLTANHFSFYLSGQESGSEDFYALAGSVIIDSTGAVLGGEQDYNDASTLRSAEPTPDTIVAGQLQVNQTTGQGTLTLVTNNPALGVSGTETLGVQFANNNHALIIQYDGSATSSGSMDLQTLSSTPSGSYAFTLSGQDTSADPVSFAGIFSISSGSVTGIFDTNDLANLGGNVLGTLINAGTISTPDSFGRGRIGNAVVAADSSATLSLVYYVVGPEAIRLIDVDSGDTAVGSAFGQGTSAGSFSTTSLGSSVFAIQSTGIESGQPYFAAGQFTTVPGLGPASTLSGVADDNELETSHFVGTPISGTYDILNNGYGSLTITSGELGDVSVLGIYMTDPNLNLNDPNNPTGGGGALVADMDPSFGGDLAGIGVLIPQTDTSAAHFTGNYAFAAQALVNAATIEEFDFVGQGSVSSGTSLSASGIASDPEQYFAGSVVLTSFPFSGSPVADGNEVATGRYTMVSSFPNSNTFKQVIYQASGGQLFWIDMDNTNNGFGALGFLGAIEQQTPLTSLNGVPTTPIVATTSGTPQTAAIDTAFAAPLVATVTQNGSPVANVVVTFTAPGSGASGTFAGVGNTTTATTDVNGIATSSVFTANGTSGAYTVTASIAGGSTAIFSLTNLAALTIATTSGTPQSAEILNTFAAPLVATVTANGVPVQNVLVTFDPPPTIGPAHPTCTFAGGVKTATTDVNGIATSALCTADGTTGSYAVPASIPDGATATFNLTNTAPLTVNNFTFYLSGLNNDKGEVFYALAGSVIIDSTGAVLGGEQDYNDAETLQSPEPSADTILAGQLQVNPEIPGQGTLTLLTNNPALGVNRTETLGVQFVNNNHALIIQFDGTATSSGSMDLQTHESNTPSGNYAFTLSGEDFFGDQTVYGGVFSVSSGIVAGIFDINDIVYGPGAQTGTPFATSISDPDSFGRGTLSIPVPIAILSPQTLSLVYYIVGPEAIRIIDVDSSDTGVGSAFGQGANPNFSNASLGTSVFAIQSNGVGTGSPYATAGQFTVPSSGTISGVGDVNETLYDFDGIGRSITGTYTIANNGYGSLTIANLGDVAALGIYMTDPNLNLNDPNNTTTGGGGALIADMDSNTLAGTGVLIPQTDTSVSDFTGSYAFGAQSLYTDNGVGEFDFVGQGSVTNGIALSGVGLASDPGEFFESSTLLTGFSFSGTPIPDGSEATTGRYAMFPSNGLHLPDDDSFMVVIYQASGGQLFWLDLDGASGFGFLGPIEQQGDLTSLNGIPAVKKARGKTKPKQKQKP